MIKKLWSFKYQKMGQIVYVKKTPFANPVTYVTGFAKRGIQFINFNFN